MPHIVWSPRSRRDLARIDQFLRGKSPRAANRAYSEILRGVELLELFADAGRPAPHYGPSRREWIIEFGGGAYVLLYERRLDDVIVIALRNSREPDYPGLSGS